MRSVTVAFASVSAPSSPSLALRRSTSVAACVAMLARRASSADCAKVLASFAASLSSSAFALMARMLLSPSGVTVIASSTFLEVQSPPIRTAVRCAACCDLISVAAV